MNDRTLFQRVREAVDISEVARFWGLEPDRNGWCRCPFHGENTPSFHLYQQRYRCFGCDARGDAIDLVAGLLEVDPLEAVKEINRAFRLGIDLDAPADPVALNRGEEEREKKRRFQTWRENALLVLGRRFRAVWLRIKAGRALATPGCISDDYAAALREIEPIGYYLDILTFEDEETIRSAVGVVDEAVARITEEEKS
ncbi:MAG: CHC2 zinc finger domain-containing protein [Pseudoflavonifractor sp.]|nr:CHC2 zinc finger domain-containing protein [Pseudoflavonifractor sp.]